MLTEADLDRIRTEQAAARRAALLQPLPVDAEIAGLVRELSGALERWLARPQPANHTDMRLRCALNEWRKATGTT